MLAYSHTFALRRMHIKRAKARKKQKQRVRKRKKVKKEIRYPNDVAETLFVKLAIVVRVQQTESIFQRLHIRDQPVLAEGGEQDEET